MANTAWSVLEMKNDGSQVQQSVIDIAASTATYYTNVITFAKPNLKENNRWISVLVQMGAAASTHVEVALYGAMTATGSKFALKTTLVTNLATGALNNGGVVDLNAYPAPYYFIGVTTDADDSANDATVTVFVPMA